MPNRARVQELISNVERGRFLEAMREFYHDEVAMQENNEMPRIGLAACLDHEARFVEGVQAFHKIRAASFLVDGDRAAIHWVFDLTLKDGRRLCREEIAYQRWEDEKILCERFFFDTETPFPSDSPVLSLSEQKRERDGAAIACAVVGDRGQITLPSALFRQRALAPGDRLLVTDSPLGLGLWVSEAAAEEPEGSRSAG